MTNIKLDFADLEPSPIDGEFADAVKRRHAYGHLSDFGYKVIVDLGCPWLYEEMVAINHMRFFVPHEYVQAVKKLAYEYTPVIMRTDVEGRDAPLVRAD
jgi:phosphotransferase system IIA component